MIHLTHSHARSWPTLLLVGITALGLMSAAAMFIVGGSKHDIVFSLAVTALPVTVIIAATRPLVFPFGLYVLALPFDNLLDIPGFGTITKLLGLLSGACILFWLIRHNRLTKPSLALIVWLAFLLWASLSVFWAADASSALSRLLTYVELILLLAGLAVIPADRTDIMALIFACIVGSLIAALYAIYLFHSGDNLVYQQVGGVKVGRVFIQGAQNVKGDEIDPNHFGNALLLPIALISVLMLRRRWSVVKLLLLFGLAILVGGVYASGSRESLLAVIVVFLVLLRTPYWRQIVVFGLLIFALTFALPNSPWMRFSGALETGGSGRLAVWRVGLEALYHHWQLGIGVGNFPVAYDQAFDKVYQPPNQIEAHWNFVAHNTPLGMSVELGLLGLVLLLFGWYLVWRDVEPGHYTDPEMRDYAYGIQAAIMALFVASMFIDMLPYKYLWLAFNFAVLLRSTALSNRGHVCLRTSQKARYPILSQANGQPKPE
jgi:hypothetical protein